MSKTAHDQYIDVDEEEETCPLCIEDFDLTDKGFKPCPCGYQVCQFCYNSIKTNMNGLCPACRRPYDDKQIEYKVITPEETAAYKARQAQKQKKTQAALQKEKQKAEADSLSRKHLAGLRVVQKNLVYVTGIAPKMQEDELLQTLRGDKYFGRYGKIIKIVVSKARDKHDSVGVYVTYERKEDAASCIAAVDGFVSDDRTLRAQFGTTKYCSAYLRGDTCMNRNCMFLHEPGEAKDSYSRADLSALNAGSSQHGEAKAPPPQSQQPVSAAQPMVRQTSDPPSSPTFADRPALPSTASWASKPALQRPESRPVFNDNIPDSTMETAPVVTASPAPTATAPAVSAARTTPPEQIQPVSTRAVEPVLNPLHEFVKSFRPEHLCFTFDRKSVAEEDLAIIDNYPALFDPNGGVKWKARKLQEEKNRLELEAQAFQAHQASPELDNAENVPELSGSMQLGGEPEERHAGSEGQYEQRFGFGNDGPTEGGMTPQQQYLMQNLKAGSSAASTPSHPPGHQRNVSRYTFANDTSSASTAVKPVANQKLMNQQSAMMPPSGTTNFGTQHQSSNFYTSNVPHPPPGLKATGTPPVSGGMTFGQGHGFTTGGPSYGTTTRNEEMMRDIIRNQNATKLDEEAFPALGSTRQASISSISQGVTADVTRRSTPTLPPGFEDYVQSRRATPTVPPGLSKTPAQEQKTSDTQTKPTALPDLEGLASRPSSRASLRRAISSQIVPALPLRVGTPVKPSRPSTPSKLLSRPTSPGLISKQVVPETTTKKDKSDAVDVIGESLSRAVAEESNTDVFEAEPTADKSASINSATVQTAENVADMKSTTVRPDTTLNAVTDTSSSALNVSKRKHPGKLDISTAIKQPQEATVSSPAEDFPTLARRVASQATSVPSAPSSPSVAAASPLAKNGPRTIRLVQTPKTETPPSATAPTVLPAIITRKLPSRQPSVASMNVPGTPTSEQVSISDNISVTSTSQSRANSPPPTVSKVGSAPVRTKTKSQLKKDRQERAKAMEEERTRPETGNTVIEEPAQEAIVGRKKKAKKDKEVKLKSKRDDDQETIPVVSQPASPAVQPPAAVEEKPSPVAQVVRPTPELSPPATPTLSPAQLIHDLRSDKLLAELVETLFRVPAVSSAKNAQSISAKDIEQYAASRTTDISKTLTREEIDELLEGMAQVIHPAELNDSAWNRAVITAGGAHLRALTLKQEQQYIYLEAKDRQRAEELRFRPTKPQNETRFPMIDIKALKKALDSRGPRDVSVMEQMVQDGSAMKKGAFLVDEVSKYINEFVMPPATPPPSAGRGASTVGQQTAGGQAAASTQAGTFTIKDGPVPSMDIIERQLGEAKRAVDEREGALRRVVRKNKKLLGMNS